MEKSVCYHNSYWMTRVSHPSNWGKLIGDIPKVDVVIVGAGITGLSAAIKLKEAGKKVAVIEGLRVGTGVTSNSTAKLTSLHNLTYAQILKNFGQEGAQSYASLNEYGIKVVAENDKKYNLESDFEWRDNVTYTNCEENIEMIKQEVEAAKKAGLEPEFISEMKELPFEMVAGIKLKSQAQFNPYKYCLGLAKQIDGNGSYLFEESRVQEVSNTTPHRISTTEGSILADYVIIATHLPILDRSGHFAFCKPMRSYCLAYLLKEKMPPFMSISVEDTPTISIRDAEDGQVLIIGGNGHSNGKPSHSRHELHYQELDAIARKNWPVDKLLSRWSAHDYMSPDLVPYIGKLSRKSKTIFTATGFKKWGLATGAGSSQIFLDLIEGKENSWLKLFDATRFDLKNSAINVGKFQLEVGKNFIVDKVRDFARVPNSLSLGNGEGGIVKHQGKVCAMYKYPDGKIVTLSPSCSHLGCNVKWNDADLAWDCPCHGSRFSVEGEVLHGPATKSLKRFEW